MPIPNITLSTPFMQMVPNESGYSTKDDLFDTQFIFITKSLDSFENELEIPINIENNASEINALNHKRIAVLENNFIKRLIACILDENFEYGMESQAYLLVKAQMKINALATKNWINTIYIDNFHNSEILIGLLHIIARFDIDEIGSVGQTIALASLSHEDEVVQETAIRAFECWGGLKSLEILKHVSVSSIWIQDYLNGVISDLKAEYVS